MRCGNTKSTKEQSEETAAMVYQILLLPALCCGSVFALNVRTLPASSVRRSSAQHIVPFPLDVDPAAYTIKQPEVLVDTKQDLPLSYNRDEQLSFGISRDLLQRQVADSAAFSSDTTTFLSMDKDESSFTLEQAGKWFFVLYVAVSFAAGFKELGVRFQTWLQNRDDK